MKIKVCGLKYSENIREVSKLGPDFIGLIFYDKSPRFVNESLSINEAKDINAKKVGVFVNEEIDSVLNNVAHYNLDIVQLHGNESAEYCEELKAYVRVIKAFGIDSNFDFKTLKFYENHVDYFLFDTATPNHGGSGKPFAYELLNNYNLTVPFFISGGISLENIETIKQLNIKHLYGVDINSKFEISPGLKNVDKVKQFIDQLK